MLRIGLISDTHIPEARPELWPQVFHAFRDVDVILHAGDIHDLRVIDQLGELATIYVARGNGDDGDGGRPVQPPDLRLENAWVVELGGLRVGLTHTMPIPERPPRQTVAAAMTRLFGRTDLDVLIYGDTHVEAVERIGGMLCVNPGSPTFPHNLTTRLGTIGFMEIGGGRADATIWEINDDGLAPFDWSGWRPHW